MDSRISIKAYLIVIIRVKRTPLIEITLPELEICINLNKNSAMQNQQIPKGVKRELTKVHASDLISKFSSKIDLFLYLHEQVSQSSIQFLIPLL